jgi:hypothetical protein
MVLNAEEKSTYNTYRSLRVSPAYSITCSSEQVLDLAFRISVSEEPLNSASSGAMSPMETVIRLVQSLYMVLLAKAMGRLFFRRASPGFGRRTVHVTAGFCPDFWRVGLDPHDFHEVVDGGLECVGQCL